MSITADQVQALLDGGLPPEHLPLVMRVIEQADEERKAKQRDRVKRHRMKRDVTDVTLQPLRNVTPPPNDKSSNPPPKEKPPLKGGQKERGQRLQNDWVLPPDWREWVVNDRGWTEQQVDEVAEGFRDYWTAKTGRDAAKLDWFATWRNWCRNQRSFSARAGPNGGFVDPWDVLKRMDEREQSS